MISTAVHCRAWNFRTFCSLATNWIEIEFEIWIFLVQYCKLNCCDLTLMINHSWHVFSMHCFSRWTIGVFCFFLCVPTCKILNPCLAIILDCKSDFNPTRCYSGINSTEQKLNEYILRHDPHHFLKLDWPILVFVCLPKPWNQFAWNGIKNGL